MNTWPDNLRRPLTPTQHENWNATHYPGTRQLCVECNEPTERCEDDSIYAGDLGPLCIDCWHKTPEYQAELADYYGPSDLYAPDGL